MKNIKLSFIALLTFFIAVFSCSMVQFNKVKAADLSQVQKMRLGGSDRFDTSVKIADYGWKNSNNVVIADAEGDNAFADAVTGTSLAYYLNCPILLTNVNSTPGVVKDEIAKLGVKNIYIMGGTGVVSKSQEDSFRADGYNTIRIAGSDRFDTACKAADVLNSKSKVKKVYIAPADKFQYSLIAAPYAAREGAVVLFTDGDRYSDINSITKNEILKLGVENATVVGSYNIVSHEAEAQLEDLGVNCLRIHGTTPQSVASSFMNNNKNSNGISIASSKMFPDALSSSVITAKNNYNTLLVDSDLRYNLNDNVKSVLIFGGTASVSDDLKNYIKDANTAKDISNDEIYQLFADSWVSMEDIWYSADNKEQLKRVITTTDEEGNPKEYVPAPEQYNSDEKVRNVILNYDTDEYADQVLSDFNVGDIDGKIVIPYGQVGESFFDTKKILASRENIDDNTIQVTYDEYGASGACVDTILVTLKFENNTWKVSDTKWNNISLIE